MTTRRALLASAAAIGLLLGMRYTEAAIPGQITGLKLWLEADVGALDGSGNPCVNGSVVATWRDQSGNTNDATQATSGNRPTFAAGAFNGLPAISFSKASDQYLNNAYAGDPASGATIFVVYQQSDPAAGENVIGAAATTGSVGAYGLSSVDPATGTSTMSRALSGAGTWNAQTQATQGALQTLCYTNDGTVAKLYRGSTLCQSVANPGGTPLTITAPIVIGAGWDGSIASYLQGYVCELLWFDVVLTTANQAAVMNYLYAKWGLNTFGTYVATGFQRPVLANQITKQLLMWQSADGLTFEPLACNYVPTFGDKICRDNEIIFDAATQLYWNFCNNGNAASGGFTSTFSVSNSAGPQDGWNFTDQYQVSLAAVTSNDGVWEPHVVRNLDGTPWTGDGYYHCFPSVNFTGTQLFHIKIPVGDLNTGPSAWILNTTAISTMPTPRVLDAWTFFDGTTFWAWVTHFETGGDEYIELYSSTSIDTGYTAVKTGDWAGWSAAIGGFIEHPCLYRLPSGTWVITFDGPDLDSTFYSLNTNPLAYAGAGTWSAPVVMTVSDMANPIEGFTLLGQPYAIPGLGGGRSRNAPL